MEQFYLLQKLTDHSKTFWFGFQIFGKKADRFLFGLKILGRSETIWVGPEIISAIQYVSERFDLIQTLMRTGRIDSLE
jgi:hypothetical protein